MMDALHLHECINVLCTEARLAVTDMDLSFIFQNGKKETSGLSFPYDDMKLQLKSLSRTADRDQGHIRAIYELLQDPAHVARCSVCHVVRKA